MGKALQNNQKVHTAACGGGQERVPTHQIGGGTGQSMHHFATSASLCRPAASMYPGRAPRPMPRTLCRRLHLS